MSIKGTGRRGPPGKSPHLKLISGTDRADRATSETVKISSTEMPTPPSHLNSDELAAWHEAINLLKPMGLLSNVDVAILMAYCVSRCVVQHASTIINGNGEFSGLLIQGTAGPNIPNPLIAIRRHAMADTVSYAIQLGMTPAARLRLNAEVGAKKKTNPFDALKDD